MNRRSSAGLAAVVAGLAVLSGCTGNGPSAGPAAGEPAGDPYGLREMLDPYEANEILTSLETWEVETALSDAQLGDLSDGEVTEEEYQGAFERYRSCLRDEGYELVNVGMNGSFVDFGLPDAAVQSGADDRCYFGEFFATSHVWTTKHMDEADRASEIARCAGESGIDTSTESGHPPTTAELEQRLIDAGIDPDSCS